MLLYIELGFVLFLILLNGVFAMSELAIVSSKKVHLKRMADEGRRSAQLALDFAENTGRFLPTVQIGITLIGILAGAFSGAALAEPFAQYLHEYMSMDTAEVVAVTSIVIIVTYVTLIIGELVPKELALRNPERLAMFVAPIIHYLARMAAPLVWVLNMSSTIVLKLIGAGEKPETTVTEEEVRSLIDEGTEHGLFHEVERDMISGVMLLADKPIRAFMMPRMDVITIAHTATLDEVRSLIDEYHFTSYPIERDGLIIGVLQTKKLLSHILAGKPYDMEELLQPVIMFPDTKPTVKVIEHLRKSPIHMSIIVDEHGSFVGIATLNDLVEVITGELYQYVESHEATERDDGSWLMDGSLLVDIAFQKLGIGMPEDNGYHTMAGFVLHHMAVIPKEGTHFEYANHRFEVVDMDGIRIDKILVSKIT